MKGTPWKSVVVLVAMIISFVFSLSWLWALVLLFWAIPGLISGVTYIVEPVDRREFPVLYWSLMITWLAFSGYLLVVDFFPGMLPTGWA